MILEMTSSPFSTTYASDFIQIFRSRQHDIRAPQMSQLRNDSLIPSPRMNTIYLHRIPEDTFQLSWRDKFHLIIYIAEMPYLIISIINGIHHNEISFIRPKSRNES